MITVQAMAFAGLGVALLLNFWYIVLTRKEMPQQQKVWLGAVNHLVAAGAFYWAYLHFTWAGM